MTEHVQRRVRAHRRRHHERRAEERHQPVSTARRGSSCAAPRWMRTRSRTTRSARPIERQGHAPDPLSGSVRLPGGRSGPHSRRSCRKDGPVKLFYMGAFENYREGTPNPLIVSYPEAEMRNGDFSKLVNSPRAAESRSTIRSRPRYDAAGNVVTPRSRSREHHSRRTGSTRSRWRSRSTCRCRTGRRRPDSRYANNNLFAARLLRQGQVLQPDPEVRLNFGSKHRAFFRHASNDRTEDRAGQRYRQQAGHRRPAAVPAHQRRLCGGLDPTVSPTVSSTCARPTTASSKRASARANDGFDLTSLGIPKSLLAQLPSPTSLLRPLELRATAISIAGPQPEQQLHQHLRAAGQRHQGRRARTRSRPASTSARSTTSCRTPATS